MAHMRRLLALGRSYLDLGAILGVYVVGALAMMPWYRYIINPDGIAYMSIAKKYATGDLGGAVNGYWGPLLSWLLTPFALIDRNLLLAFRLVNIGAGAAIVLLMWGLLGQLRVGRMVQRCTTAVLVPLVWYWSMPTPITPDLLMVVMVLAYFYVLLMKSPPRLSQAVLLGVVGALGYFTKSFFLPFFVVHLTLYAGVQCLRLRRRTNRDWQPVAARYLVALAVTGVLILPWAAAISIKYHQPTLSTSGTYNFNLIGPQYAGLHPMEYRGLLPPPNASALSTWEDPTYISPPRWSPLASVTNLRYFEHLILENLRVIMGFLLTFSVLSLGFLLFVVYRSLSPASAARGRPTAVQGLSAQAAILLGIAVYVAGYAIVTREERYFWPNFSLLILLAAIVTREYNFSLRRLPEAVLLATAVASVWYIPSNVLAHKHGEGAWLHEGAVLLAPYFTGTERIASDRFEAIAYCYYFSVPCYGKLNPLLGDEENTHQLLANGISDVLIYDLSEGWQPPEYLVRAGFTEVDQPYPAVRLLRRPGPIIAPAQGQPTS